MTGECSACGRPLRVSSGIGPKCAQKLGGATSPTARHPPMAGPPPVHPGQTTIPIQLPLTTKEN